MMSIHKSLRAMYALATRAPLIMVVLGVLLAVGPNQAFAVLAPSDSLRFIQSDGTI